MNTTVFACTVAVTIAGGIFPSRGLAQASLPEPVSITPQQSKILLTSANSLNGRLKDIGAAFSIVDRSTEWTKVQQGLLDLTNREEKFAISTQEDFDKEFSFSNENGRRASKTYFGYIRNLYTGVRAQIQGAPAGPAAYRELKTNVVGVYEKIATTYTIVATSGNLTFNLEVNSDPRFATVSLRRVGDKPERYPSLTNTTVKNLPMAQWFVKVELADHVPQEKMHDPFREPDHKIDFVLQKK